MAIVYITNHDPNVNYSMLSRHGSVAHVTSGLTQDRDDLIKHIASVLIQSKETDYLCIAGDPLTSAIVLSMWLQVHPSVHLIVLHKFGTETCRLDRPYLLEQFEKMRDLVTRR